VLLRNPIPNLFSSQYPSERKKSVTFTSLKRYRIKFGNINGLLNKIKGEHIMKKVLILITAFMLIFSSLVYAGGDKVRGDKGQGSTGTSGTGTTTQTRGD
jgi:hypothetical protein